MIDRQAIVLVATKGRYTGKPRPWVVVQNDVFRGTDSVTLCLITHVLVPNAALLRIDIAASSETGLKTPSQIQVEKIVTVRREDIDRQIGRLYDASMAKLGEALRFFLDV